MHVPKLYEAHAMSFLPSMYDLFSIHSSYVSSLTRKQYKSGDIEHMWPLSFTRETNFFDTINEVEVTL